MHKCMVFKGRALRIAVGITMLVLVMAGGAGAAMITVNASGGADYTKIQDAVNAASNGDTIVVTAGTYNENVNVYKSVILVGAGAGVTIIYASNPNDYVLNITANYVNISGFTISGAMNKAGIYLSGANYTNISDNIASSNSNGISLDKYSSNNTLTNNTVTSNTVNGIYLYDSSNNTLTNNNVNSNTGNGININNLSSSNIILNNSASSNTGNGIRVQSPRKKVFNVLLNNTILNNSGGVSLYQSMSNNISYNTIQENNNYDVSSDECDNIIENNIGSGNRPIKYFNHTVNLQNEFLSELILCKADNSILYNITIEGSATKKNNGLIISGVNSYLTYINSSNNNIGISTIGPNITITNSTANSNNYGIYINSGSNIAITNSITNSNSGGIYIGVYGSKNKIINNIANSNTVGIEIRANNNEIINNTANYNNAGIYLFLFAGLNGNNNITGNTIKENMDSDVKILANYDAQNADCDNILNDNIGSGDRPIKYFNYSINLQNELLSELILCNADNSNIDNVTIEGSETRNNGLFLIRTDNTFLTNINSSKNNYGIYLSSYSTTNTIKDSTFSNDNYGIYLSNSNSNSIINSKANTNNNDGVYLGSSSSNNIINNTINSNNADGINLYYQNYNNFIMDNKINSNSQYGIHIISSGSNTIYNNFLKNNNNVLITGTNYGNYWNTTKRLGTNIVGGYYLGGNFWANLGGTGYSEKCGDIDSDGICDSSYGTGYQDRDYLPLAAPDITNPTVVISSPANNTIVNTSSVNILGISSDTRSGIQKVEVQVDEGVFNIVTGTISWTYSISSLSDGLHRMTARATDNASNTATTSINITVDTTPPATIKNLANVTYASMYINWTWTDPADIDFNHVEVYLDGIQKPNILAGVRYYNATGLSASTTHEISTRTVDNSGNVNATWKNHTATTAPIPDTSAPSSVTGLTNITYAQTYINWTWIDSIDTDFNHVEVYLDGIQKPNVLAGVQYYNATGLTASTTHEISTRTVDNLGNVNATWKNHTATTATTATTASLPVIRYINGTVKDHSTGDSLSGVRISANSTLSTTTNAAGFYSFAVTDGSYNLISTINDIRFYTNTTTVSTTGQAVVIQDIEMVRRPTGNITGSVMKV